MAEDTEGRAALLTETAGPETDSGRGTTRPLATSRPARPPLFTKRTIVAIAIFAGVLLFFLTQTRLPSTLLKLETADRAQTARGRLGFGQVIDPESVPGSLRWVAYGVNLWDGNAIGMFFAMLLGGAAMGVSSPVARLRRFFERRGALGAGVGGVMGVPLMMCSACSTPVSLGFYRSGATVETSLGVIIGSALFNPLGIIAMFAVLPPEMGVARVAFGLVMLLGVAPLLASAHRRRAGTTEPEVCDLPAVRIGSPAAAEESWPEAIVHGLRDWVRNSLDVAWRLGPVMLLATLGVGVVFTVAPPQTFSDRIGAGLLAVVLAAGIGALLQTPALFEVPLTLGLVYLGLDTGPATALLVTAPAAGLITLALVRKELGWRTPLLLMAATFVGGVVAGTVVGAL